jgi:hypothetical protein
MVLIRSDSCSRVLGIPHPAAPPPLATRSRTGCRERSNDQAYCFDRGRRTIGHCRQLGCSGSYRLLAASNFRRSVYAAINAPINIKASVALKLPGVMQLMQVPMMAGASNMARLPIIVSPAASNAVDLKIARTLFEIGDIGVFCKIANSI